MKFTAALSALLVIMPLVAAVPAQQQGHGVQNAHFAPPPPAKHNAPPPPPKKAAPPPPPNHKAAPPPPPSRGGKGGNKGGNTSAAATTTAAAAGTTNAAAATTTTTTTAAASTTTAAAASNNSTDPQTSLELDPTQVQPGLAQDGQAVQEAGQVPSLTSVNNFINFCLLFPNLPLTNGQQIVTGSCNPTIMGQIIPKANMPSAKFTSPTNFQAFAPNETIPFKLAVNNMETGNFVNANLNYFAAPQQLNDQNLLVAHSHVTCNEISSFQDTTPLDPQVFAFFKGLNAPAVDGILEADATGGLPPGFYRVCSINTAANHQPALVAVAQHASLDDCVYFQVADSQDAADAANAAVSGSGSASDDSGASTDAATDAASTTNATDAATTNAAAATTSAASAAQTTAASNNKSLKQSGSNGAQKVNNNKRPTFTPPNRNQNQRPGQQQFGRPGGRNRFEPNFRGGRGRGRF